MASEPTRQKHHRSSSPDEAEGSVKRHKHRDNKHRSRHRRHRSKQEKEETNTKSQEGGEVVDVDVEGRKSVNDGDAGGGSVIEVAVHSGPGFAGVNYDMEEGEILEDDDLVDHVNDDIEKVKKKPESDHGSEKIDTNGYDNFNMEVNEDNVRVDKNSRKLETDSMKEKKSCEMDREREPSSFDDEIERRNQRQFLSSKKKHSSVAYPYSNDKYVNEGSPSCLLESPKRSRGRSHSRSILQETSVMSTAWMMGNPKYIATKQRNESDDDRIVSYDRNYRHSSRYDGRSKETECTSSRSTERMDMHHYRETHGRDREGSKDRDQNRSRMREKDSEEEQEKEKNGEHVRGKARTQDRYLRDRGSVKDRARDRDMERERDRGREGIRDVGRDGHKYKDTDNESDRLSRRQIYGNDEDGFRNRGNGYRHRRDSEDLHRERSRRNNVRNGNSKCNPEEREDSEVLQREEGKQEDYQEKIVMQLAEQEEDDLERIKEESRRLKQAILEKHKNKSTDQQNETHSQVSVEEQVGRSSEQSESAEVVENIDIQMEPVDIFDAESSFSVGTALERRNGTGGLGDGTPKSERSVDMFHDDIFGVSPAGVRKMSKGDVVAMETSGLHDNWDDAEGYYGYRIGEMLNGRYEIVAAQGKGVFSTVVRARDLKAKPGDPEEVAIKIIRSNETMYKAGMEELVILKKLVGTDPEDRRHCVRFLSTFKYRNHLCLVFESLHMNLREVIKKFGRNIGLKLTAVRLYAKQLFIALKHLKNCGVLHCDIKPDNMLVNEAKSVLKLCDFGNAMFAGKNEITPYLVSRFYRAPEIILGLPYDHPMDMWSVGCCLFELYTGKVLFPGSTNNDMLRLHMELKGPFPKKMLRKGGFVDHHFDQDLNFLATEEDHVTQKTLRRLLVNIKPKDFGSLMSGSRGEDLKLVAKFKDLMDKIFVLDPEKRLDVSQALSHPFITGK